MHVTEVWSACWRHGRRGEDHRQYEQETRQNYKRKSREVREKKAEQNKIKRELRSNCNAQDSISETKNKLESTEDLFKKKSSSVSIKKYENSISQSRRKKIELKEELDSRRRTREQLVRDQNEQARLQFSKDSAKTKKAQVESLTDELHDALSS